MKKYLFLFLLLSGYAVKVQLNVVSSFNPPGITSLCALGNDNVSYRIWIYNCFGDSLLCYDTTGQKLFSVPAPGEQANDVDIEIAPVAFQLAGTNVPQGA